MSERQWPVSVKGVVVAADHVLLLANERGEWELPGGRLEAEESPQDCVRREIHEETGLRVEVDRILDSWLYPVLPARKVLIVTYVCVELDELPSLTISAEHRSGQFASYEACTSYTMPDGYRRSIQSYFEARRRG